MADPSSEPQDGNNFEALQGNFTGNPAASLEQMQGLLKAKDDTSRFVGLALLKSVLDNSPQLRENESQLKALWEAISPKFLDRLLRAGQNDNVTKDEARDMADIAVAVLHTFTILLPLEARNETRLVGRLPALVNALLHSTPESTVLILQTIATIVTAPLGAKEFMKLNDVSTLTEIAPQQPLVLDIFSSAWSTASTEVSGVAAVRSSLNSIIPLLLVGFKFTDAVTFLAFIGSTFPKLPPEVIPKSPEWLKQIVALVRKLIVSRPTKEGRSAYTEAAATLLQMYPEACPPLLFGVDESATKDSKPFSYLFLNLILIDIRSSFPSLLSQINSPEYPSISKRLGAAFDIVSSFVGFLVRNIDEDGDAEVIMAIKIPPDLLLKLRKDIAETLSLTIEYLRDRYDASIAGASGLHPSARSGTSATSEGTRLTLTWESTEYSITSDTLILASIRTLAIWLREDDNENLRNESAGLMDLFIHLYKASSQLVEGVPDFRQPLLTALESILTTEDGVEEFLGQEGWEVLTQDLNSAVRSTLTNNSIPDIALIQSDASRGIDIIRVLLAVVDHESTTAPREVWMNIVKAAATIPTRDTVFHPIVVELKIAVLQLAVALLSIAPAGMQKRYSSSITGISGAAVQLRKEVIQLDGSISREFLEELDGVRLGLDNIQ